jgi:hypothetical protein
MVGGLLRKVLRSFRRWVAAVALVAASTAVSLLVLEAALRVGDGVPLMSVENFVARELDGVHKKGTSMIHDPRLGWAAMPHSNWDLEGKHYTFGEYGARMAGSQVVPLQQGAILVVGDSFATGYEVSDADSWPAQLERMIGTQVINAAFHGYGLDQIVMRAEDLVPRLKPRMLLVQTRLEFGISVARMSVFGGAPKPYFAVRDGKLELSNEPVPAVAATSDDIGWMRSVLGYSYLIQYVMTRLDLLQWWVSQAMATKFVLSDSQAVDVTCLLMRRLAELRDQYNVSVFLVFQYSAIDGTESKIHWEADRARVFGCAGQEKLEIVDTLGPLRSATIRGHGRVSAPLEYA